MDKVSVVIPTYNRFNYLLNLIKSVKEQTYKNIEIIVVNDCSTQKEYYEYNFTNEGVKMIHLPNNSKKLLGFACAGLVRSEGIKQAQGKYVAFCDDDDIWFPQKIELQMKAMKETGCKMSCTDGLIGHGIYNDKRKYAKYMTEHYYKILQDNFRNQGCHTLDNGFPDIWDLNLIKLGNLIICSSVMMEKTLLDKINFMKYLKNGDEDYDCWLRALEHTNCVFVPDICIYYDLGHGDGQNY